MSSISNILIGPAEISFGGVELGFTTDDGVKFSEEVKVVEFTAAQTAVIGHVQRTQVKITVAATFNELTLDNWSKLSDMKAASSGGVLNLDYAQTLTERPLIITSPGVNGATRVGSFTAVVITPGDKVFSNGVYTGAPVVFQLIGDPSNDRYGTITESAGGTVPAVTGYEKVASGSAASDGHWDGTSTALADGDTSVPVTSAVSITFNTDIRIDQVNASKAFLLLVGANTLIAATLYVGDTTNTADHAKIVVVPSSSLAASSTYNLIIPEGIVSMDGLKSTAGYAMQFTTA